MDRTTYEAVATRSDGWWAIEVPALDGVFTQARRLDQVDATAREAIALLLDVPEDSFDVKVTPVLDPQVIQLVDMVFATKQRAEEAAQKATDSIDAAVRELLGDGLTLRDAGELLHVSYQRVQQIAERAMRAVQDATRTRA